MSISNLFDDKAAVAGWAASTQVDVLLRYIENQQSDDVFEDFLDRQIEEESAEDVDGG